jgi:hypothetical protein
MSIFFVKKFLIFLVVIMLIGICTLDKTLKKYNEEDIL